MATHFNRGAMTFLRGLARNNDRVWFEKRRAIYERELKAPMLTLIDEITAAMAEFAPEHMRPAPKTMMRIYRDIRFSADKRPYKTHLAAWWARRGMEKTSGGGYYLHIGPKECFVAAGVYMPEREQLLALRRWMAEHHREYRALTAKLLKPRARSAPAMTVVDEEMLTRMPKGFPACHPADELLRARNWGLHATLPEGCAVEPVLLKEILRRFRLLAPVVDTLNEAILSGASAPRRLNANRFL
ncbi:MAG TPA: DUF2461 domain-containing protein [Acidobacteriaceae bacterium]|nr:DUF2461 domain-containing protein [Acidobacteriaceae bacterium]